MLIFYVDRYHLVGITSYGHMCNEPGYPGKLLTCIIYLLMVILYC